MKKKVACFLPAIFVSLLFFGQTERAKKTRSNGGHVAAGAGVHFPLGNFSKTHTVGFGIDVSPARHRFGLMGNKKLAFTYNAGVTWYKGKQVQVSGYPYEYPGFTFIHGYAGLLYNPLKKLIANLQAGPALGIYIKDTRFNIGAKLEGSYYIRKTAVAAGPLLTMMLEPGTGPLWSVGVKARMDL